MIEVLALLTGLVVLASAITTWRTKRQIQQVHVMVNSQRQDMMNELRQLRDLLVSSGVRVPEPPAPVQGPEAGG